MSRALAAAVALAALPALATPSGHMWFQTACSGSNPCGSGTECVASKCIPVFRVATSIDNSGASTFTGVTGKQMSYATFLGFVNSAFQRWSSAYVTSCATSYQVQRASTSGAFSSPTGIAAVSDADGANNVIWLSGGNWRYSAATLGLTTGSFITSTGQLLDADMELNDNVNWTDSGDNTSYDMESVVLHEAGHFLGLDHTNNVASAVMYPTVPFGDAKRSLTSTDSTDVCTVYPGAAGSQGTPCSSGTACTGGRVCEGAPSATQKICTQDCTAVGQTCPQGYSCQPSTNGSACLTQQGSTDLCKFCSQGADCSTGLCVTDGAGHNWCTLSCTSAAQCGTGYDCVAGTGGSFCQKPNNALCTTQCTGNGDCAVGYTCSSGTCQPTGNVGDRCEVSGWCKSCSACVLDPNDNSVAFCRSCCAGQNNGGYCSSCSSTSCGSTESCVPLANNKDSVCLPTGGGALCQPCSGSCPSGMTCSFGSCHSTCNPQSPGACGACVPLTSTTGVCACGNEIVGNGDHCGASSTSLLACGAGLVCVNGSAGGTCQASCNLNDPASCGVGESCQNVGGAGVCLPTSGLRCGPCSASNTCSGTDSCYNSQCYQSCNVNQAGHCATCVQTAANGDGVCACSNQIAATGEVCGLQPDVAACNTTDRCIDGVCRQPCDPAQAYLCPPSTDCQAVGGGNFCVDLGSSGGGGGTGGSGGAGGSGGTSGTGGAGGTGGGTTADSGCGCTSGAGLAALWPYALVALALRRRRG